MPFYDLVKSQNPDVVILASGITPNIPDIPGITGANVALSEDILTGKVVAGPNVVVMGGELIGCETTEFLADRGHKVAITRRSDKLALKMPGNIRTLLMRRLEEKKVAQYTGVSYKEINGRGLIIKNKEGVEQTLKTDTIVLATGAKPNSVLLDGLKESISEVYQAGDCLKPRSIMDAVADGYNIALKI